MLRIGQSAAKISILKFMSSKSEIIWLAGLMEGDGSICLHRYRRQDTKGKENPEGNWRIACDVLFINNDPNLINEVDRIVRKYIGVKMYLVTRQHENTNHATNYQIVCSSYTDCYKFLKAVVPYMRGQKRAIGCLMMRFLESRGVNRKEPNMMRQPYKDLEHRIYEQTKELTQTGVDKKLLKCSETKDETLLIKSDDIVRTSAKSEEVNRNVLPPQIED